MTHPVLVSTISPNTRLPMRSSDGSAGWDLFAHNVQLNPDMGTATVGTGLRVAFPNSMVMCLFARSGLGSNFGLVPANGTGIIDSDYRGEIVVKFANLSAKAFHKLQEIKEAADSGYPQRVVQALFLPVIPVSMVQANDLPDTVRGAGGFGSTG